MPFCEENAADDARYASTIAELAAVMRDQPVGTTIADGDAEWTCTRTPRTFAAVVMPAELQSVLVRALDAVVR
jgi:hypothetical protein